MMAIVSTNIYKFIFYTEKYSHYITSIDSEYNFTLGNHGNTLQGSSEKVILVRIAENPYIYERKLFKNILRFIK